MFLWFRCMWCIYLWNELICNVGKIHKFKWKEERGVVYVGNVFGIQNVTSASTNVTAQCYCNNQSCTRDTCGFNWRTQYVNNIVSKWREKPMKYVGNIFCFSNFQSKEATTFLSEITGWCGLKGCVADTCPIDCQDFEL